MRWLVFFLCILNVLTFAWFMFQKDQEQQLQAHAEKLDFDFSSVPAVTLLQEMSQAELVKRDLRRVAVAKQQEEAKQAAEVQCAMVGPFPEVVTAKQIRGRLNYSAENSSIIMIAKPLPPVHWIFIPPSVNREAAMKKIEQLRGDGIDSFLMTDSDSGYENAISLGVYSKLESAQQVLAEIETKGYKPELTKKLRQKEAYWLALNQQKSESFNVDKLEQFRLEIPEIKKQEKSCQSIAVLQSFE
jgi:hypothetical protein